MEYKTHRIGCMLESGSHIQLVSPHHDALCTPSEPRWYVTYGSNLSSRSFLVKRKITPLSVKHVIIDGLVLVFDNPGVPFIEPRFANCQFVSRAGVRGKETDLWARSLLGVAYLLSPEDFQTVLRAEGGGTSLQPLLVSAVVMEKDGSRTKETLEAITLHTFIQRTGVGYPSARYMNLLRNGAREHGMPSQYLTYLDTLPSYQAHTFGENIGRLLYAGFWMLPLLLFFRVLLKQTVQYLGMATPAPIRQIRAVLFIVMWWTYDMMGWLLGDGEASA